MSNFKSNPNYFWTPQQKDLLKSAYSSGGLTVAQSLLPEKPRAAIATQACRMKLTTPKPRKSKS